jgi:hypothetical protein
MSPAKVAKSPRKPTNHPPERTLLLSDGIGGPAYGLGPNREERGMKTLVFGLVLLCTLVFGSVSWKSTAATDVQKRRAVTEFTSPVIVHGVVLKGKYLFVHDDAAMKLGDACTYIYKGEAEVRDQLVASFHCIHVERAKAKNFILRSRETAPGIVELLEFQFSGETASHGVPLDRKIAVVPLVN